MPRLVGFGPSRRDVVCWSRARCWSICRTCRTCRLLLLRLRRLARPRDHATTRRGPCPRRDHATTATIGRSIDRSIGSLSPAQRPGGCRVGGARAREEAPGKSRGRVCQDKHTPPRLCGDATTRHVWALASAAFGVAFGSRVRSGRANAPENVRIRSGLSDGTACCCVMYLYCAVPCAVSCAVSSVSSSETVLRARATTQTPRRPARRRGSVGFVPLSYNRGAGSNKHSGIQNRNRHTQPEPATRREIQAYD